MSLQYTVVFERTPNNYCAYAPDLPGCVSTVGPLGEIQENIREAVAYHITGIREDGDTVPELRFSVAEAAAYHSENAIPATEWPDAAELIAVIIVDANVVPEPAMAVER